MNTLMMVNWLLPATMAVIMFALGITLAPDDFSRVLKTPRPVLTGLGVQLILLPVFAFLLTQVFKLDPILSVGLMILAASPGGITANLFSHLSGGDVALNIALTALNSVIAAFTVPLMVRYSLSYFMGQDQVIAIQFQKMLEVFLVVLIPVFVGMFLRMKNKDLTDRLEKPLRIFSILFLVVVVVATIIKERAIVVDSFSKLGVLIVIFNVGSLALGFFSARLMKLNLRQSIGMGFEIGVHNVALAVYIAFSVIGDIRFALPGAVYSVVMYLTAGLITFFIRRKSFLIRVTRSV